MFVFITAENGLPYCLLSEIDIASLLKPSTNLLRVFSDKEYSLSLQKTSSNVVFRATTRLCFVKIYSRIARIFVPLSGNVSGYGNVKPCGVRISDHIDI